MKLLNYLFLVFIILSFSSCEEVIDLNLNTANPKYVIEADLNDINTTQVIRISQTVDFNEAFSSKPIDGATVVVTDVAGTQLAFTSIGNGLYSRSNFKPDINGAYSLKVNVGNEEFTSTTTRVPYVNVDSIGLMKEDIFNEEYYTITFKFVDPKDEDNYYKYSYAINGKPFKFAAAFSDKFNNGLMVTHEITERDKDNKFLVGDSIVVRRECINKDVYTFWNELQMLNPGSAAPANPTSNISNGALGYFSVSSAKLYDILITTIDGEEKVKE